jgi:hypothetical protein
MTTEHVTDDAIEHDDEGTVEINGRIEKVADLWSTPPSLLEASRKHFKVERYDFDACALPYTAVAPQHLGHQHGGVFLDAMRLPWNPKLPHGVAWCNPPYSRGNLLAFAQRALSQFETTDEQSMTQKWFRSPRVPNLDRIIFLGKLDPSTKWFKLLAKSPRCHEVVMLSPRVHFLNYATGKPQRGTNFCSVLFDLRRSTPKRKTYSLLEFER